MSAGLETLTVASGDRSNNAASTRWVGNEIGERAGAIDFFAMSAAPTGYLKANGAAVSRTTYAVLFAAIGTAFGAGDGSTTFNLPDIRGEFLRGWDDGRGVDGGRAFGSSQGSQNLLHNHAATAANAGAHTHSLGQNLDRSPAGDGNAIWGDENYYGTTTQTTSTAGDHTHAITVAGSGGNEARPRNVAMLACIKY
jgi:phage-related tail fiber protein